MASKRNPLLFHDVIIVEGRDTGFKGQVVDSHNGYFYIRDANKTVAVRSTQVKPINDMKQKNIYQYDTLVCQAFKDCMKNVPLLDNSEYKGILGLMLLMSDTRSAQ